MKKRRASKTITLLWLAAGAEAASLKYPKQRRLIEVLGGCGKIPVPELERRLGFRPDFAPLVHQAWGKLLVLE
ncbi:MAG: hypothetical protein AAB726_01170, partial [Patescibacteria group bacterium]